MASNQILHEFNLTYHVQSKHASSQGQAKVAIIVLMVLSKNKRNKFFTPPGREDGHSKTTTVPWASDPLKSMDLLESNSLEP